MIVGHEPTVISIRSGNWSGLLLGGAGERPLSHHISI
jgi:hypothetical protein